MQFSLDRFYRINRRALIWVALLLLIYILRDFFALIFLTFLLVSFTLPLIDYLTNNVRIPRKAIIITVYLTIFVGVCGLIWYIVPKVIEEAAVVAKDMDNIRGRLDLARKDLLEKNPGLQPFAATIEKYLAHDWQAQVEAYSRQAATYVKQFFQQAIKAISTVFLSLLFAFLIILDLTRLRAEVQKLGRSRLHAFFEQSAGPVVRFAAVIARSFRAQAMIAVVNTVLTLIGFMVLQVPNVALLSIIVFFFSFVPVLGVFISTAPAVLVALNTGGPVLAMKVIIFIILIHMVEAYILNPIIYGQHLKLNPVLIILILYVGHHFFGVWGMLLGVPVTYYFIHDVFKVPEEDPEPPPPPSTDKTDQLKLEIDVGLIKGAAIQDPPQKPPV